jgi:hypothetical protein
VLRRIVRLGICILVVNCLMGTIFEKGLSGSGSPF